MPYPTQHLAVTIPLIAAMPPKYRLPILIGGVLIDVDHILDVGLHKAGKARNHTFVLFHGLDVIAAVALIAAWRRSRSLGAVALGMTLHHAMDYAAERNWVKVSLLWRIKRRFYAPKAGRGWENRSPLTWL
ncbi:MAG: hypothetical protein M3Y58_01120 [Chloroflexota bacterium]|nr:hypothetical protein [Chloroflexota bacterium]